MIDSKQDPIAAAREALDALNYGGNWDNICAYELVRNLLAVIDGSNVPPTEAETREIQCWIMVNRWGANTVNFAMNDANSASINYGECMTREEAIDRLSLGRWVPLDPHNGFRPMPRPVVAR